MKWILAPSKGWNKQLASKLLKPVDAHGNPLTYNENGKCENTDSDFTYTQHTAWLSSKGTLTVFDNGDSRGLEQPTQPFLSTYRWRNGHQSGLNLPETVIMTRLPSLMASRSVTYSSSLSISTSIPKAEICFRPDTLWIWRRHVCWP